MTETEKMLFLPWRVVRDCCGGGTDGVKIVNSNGAVVMRPALPAAITLRVLVAIVEAANAAGGADGTGMDGGSGAAGDSPLLVASG